MHLKYFILSGHLLHVSLKKEQNQMTKVVDFIRKVFLTILILRFIDWKVVLAFAWIITELVNIILSLQMNQCCISSTYLKFFFY